MDIPESDPADETRADVADLIDQAEPAASEPVEQAFAERERIDAADPELTGEERDEAEDSGQA